MREISKTWDPFQIFLLLLACCGYFLYAASIRYNSINPIVITPSALSSSIGFLTTYGLSIGYLYIMGRIVGGEQKNSIQKLITLSTYSLLPTLTWFYLTSTFFVLVPPPRYATPLGILFSVFFIMYSLTLLNLRIMMLYMTIRFSLRTSFLSTVKIMASYLSVLIPYAFLLYKIGLFRVPFI